MLPRLWLLVGSDRPTDRPTDQQCHLLSCPGQLKSDVKKTIFLQFLYKTGPPLKQNKKEFTHIDLTHRASTEAAKECVRKFLPKLHSSCKREARKWNGSVEWKEKKNDYEGAWADVGKSATGSKPSQLLHLHSQPVQHSVQQVKIFSNISRHSPDSAISIPSQSCK